MQKIEVSKVYVSESRLATIDFYRCGKEFVIGGQWYRKNYNRGDSNRQLFLLPDRRCDPIGEATLLLKEQK